MKSKINPLSKLIAPCVAITIIAVSNVAEASITITFAQEGNNVVARTSGSLRVQAASFANQSTTARTQGLSLSGSSTGLLGIDGGGAPGTSDFGSNIQVFAGAGADQVGAFFGSSLSAAPSSFSNGAFGFTQDSLIIEAGGVDITTFGGNFVQIIEPRTVFTFENTTIEGIGLGDLLGGTTSRVVYTNSLTDDSIIFVPEPSSMLMLALGAVGFTFRRRR